jgi:hypothetical protein
VCKEFREKKVLAEEENEKVAQGTSPQDMGA